MRHALVLIALSVGTAHAQSDWSTLSPGIGAGVPLVDAFEPEWTAEVGADARLVTPAYGGQVRAALGARAYTANAEGLPDFQTFSAMLGWGPRVAGPLGTTLAAGPQVGAVLLRFDRTASGGFQNVTELEAAVGIWARLDVPLAGRLSAWLEAQAMRVAFADPATAVTAVGGLSVRLDTPGWLEAVLR